MKILDEVHRSDGGTVTIAGAETTFGGPSNAQRAEEGLGAFHAQRTLLKWEVLRGHIADAVFALTGGTSR